MSLELIGKRLLETQADQRSIRMELGLVRSALTGLEGRLIDALADRIGRFEVRMEDQLGRIGEDVRQLRRAQKGSATE